MKSKPANLKELAQALESARGTGAFASVDLGFHREVVAHVPADMTVTVQAGIRLDELQERVRSTGQWLPLDPPHPGELTINDILQGNASGPRRLGYGTARDYALGISVMLGDGTIIKSGGRVVKNVAGYDLMKLFIGSAGTLGVIVEATFKLRPLPEASWMGERRIKNLTEAGKALEELAGARLEPVLLELHNLSRGTEGSLTMVAGFEGAREDVEAQADKAGALGFGSGGGLEQEGEFFGAGNETRTQKLSVLPSRLIEHLGSVAAAPFVARAGNGIIFHQGPPQKVSPLGSGVRALMKRAKEQFDPRQVFPEHPL